jgi:nucleotide-binding universal stress UspA family protein
MHQQEEQMPAEIQNFLVATDGSESAGRAVDVAAAMAKAAHGTLKILTVGESQTALQQTDFMPADGKKANLTDRLLEEAQQRAGWTGVKPIKIIQRWGDPAQAIIDTIMEEKVDAIVIGRRGRGRLSGLLLGSVSQKLISLAPCAVIVVP